MKTEHIKTPTRTVEAHAQQTADGVEFWLPRVIQQLLGYAKWDSFSNVLAKGKVACEVSGHAKKNYFSDVRKMIDIRTVPPADRTHQQVKKYVQGSSTAWAQNTHSNRS